MPIYEYRCETCGTLSEYLVGMGKDDPVICRQCGSHEMNRILSVSSFSLQPDGRVSGRTCCGREERCDTPPCSNGGTCRRSVTP
jgi:putative FmdB family regulatory protein